MDDVDETTNQTDGISDLDKVDAKSCMSNISDLWTGALHYLMQCLNQTNIDMKLCFLSDPILYPLKEPQCYFYICLGFQT